MNKMFTNCDAKMTNKKKKKGTQKRENVTVDIDSVVLDQTRLRPPETRLGLFSVFVDG
jgi:predicted secreted acid phosphatase